MCNNFSSSGNLLVFVIGHLGHILCMGHIFLISTRHHLFFSLNYSPNQKNALYSLSLKKKKNSSLDAEATNSHQGCISKSQRALVKQGGNWVSVQNTYYHGSASSSLKCFTGEKQQSGQEEGLVPAQDCVQDEAGLPFLLFALWTGTQNH